MPAAASTSRANGRSSGSSNPKLLVVLKLSSSLLKDFVPITDTKDKRRKSSGAAASNKRNESNADFLTKKEEVSPSPASSGVEPPPASSVDNASDAASTPVPGTAADADANQKSLPGLKAGAKRSLNATSDNSQKPRGKPGPKKRPRLEDGTTENVRLSTHRLGPKANTGAINAGLRALDRSGTPCRRWERKPLQLKSFTGVQWQLPSWRAPRTQTQEPNGETKEGVLETGDSDSRANQSASGAPSEKSNSGDGDSTPAHPSMVDASSPAIAMAA
ncbi:INO80 complex, subunit Ies4 [Aspergillus tetrazonus]